jgi:hypothetical protein
MCQQLTILACDNAGHHIGRCEHGTIHIFWVRTNIFLTLDDLLNLLALLQCWQPQQPFAERSGFMLRRMASGHLQLWCACVGLLLDDAELNLLHQMVWHAVGQLKLIDSSQRQRPQRWSDEYQVLTAAPACATSLN